ncbi:MAG: alanine--tRNA ligase [Bacillota bacterium]|jgi:alanyl-tRNA synthetase
MKGNEIRRRFLQFFEGKGHTIVDSFSLVPENDPSLLIIGAGMAPLKPFFTGAKTPPNRRMASSQKCVRTGDIEMVGQTARHHTFFEMLGNFSFGDYFKKEAIAWAWEFLLEDLKIDVDKLWVSVYEEDQEAWDIWHHTMGVPAGRIVRLGKEDNFWEIGVGPCGPCSEIYVDLGPEFGCGSPECKPGCDCDRYLEIWNLVFTQFDKDEEGNYNPLPHPNIDTGMGLERLAAVLQGVPTNYDCDLIFPLIEHFADLAGVEYADQKYTQSLRILGDHFRAVAFMLADGILPSNEGRGYVLRRLLRRAVRHGILCGIEGPFLYTAVEPLLKIFPDIYPELTANKQHLIATIKAEEERFLATIQSGMELLKSLLAKVGKGGVLNGEEAFRLYDTFGFPLELTVEIAGEQQVKVDEDGFRKALEGQRAQARAAREQVDAMLLERTSDLVADLPATTFTGYSTFSASARVLALLDGKEHLDQAEAGQEILIVLDQTPFYPEGGGQVGDGGIMRGERAVVEIDTASKSDAVILHRGRVLEGVLRSGDNVTAEVDTRRRDIEANHTATHLLHHALRKVLGEHVRQAGSLVEADRLRFDFTHTQPVTSQEIQRIEQEVNALIAADLPVECREMNMEDAQRLGAIALFGEKYGATVRVVSVGDVSRELCGGTHVATTSRIRGFKILSESGIGAGLRRIEAVTGNGLLRYFFALEDTLEEAAKAAKARRENLVSRIEELQQELREQKQKAEKLETKILALESDNLLAAAEDVAGIKVVSGQVPALDMAALRNNSELILGRLGSGVVVLGAIVGDKVNLVATVSKDLVAKGIHAGKIIGEVARVAGGGGGGRPDMAQAGGKDPSRLKEALALVAGLVANQAEGK